MALPTTLSADVGLGAGPDRFPPLYRTLRDRLGPLIQAFFPLTVEGLEHLPAGEPCIIAANHHNYLDGVILAVAVPRPVAFLVMPRVYRATPLHSLFHDRLGSIPLHVARPDAGALRRALRTLEAGGVVGIFPEGPFSVRGRLERGLPGVALLALRSGVPVVPAALHGTYEALAGRRFYVPRRHPVTLRFGRPRRFAAAGRSSRAERERVTVRIMDDIAALLP